MILSNQIKAGKDLHGNGIQHVQVKIIMHLLVSGILLPVLESEDFRGNGIQYVV